MDGDTRGTPSPLPTTPTDPLTPPLRTPAPPTTHGDVTARGGGSSGGKEPIWNWWGELNVTWGAEGGGRGTHGNWGIENGTWNLDVEEWGGEGNWTAPHGNWSVNETLAGGGGAALDPHLLVTASTALVLGVMILATIVGKY